MSNSLLAPDLILNIAEYLVYAQEYSTLNSIKTFSPYIKDEIDCHVLVRLEARYNPNTGTHNLNYCAQDNKGVQRILQYLPDYEALQNTIIQERIVRTDFTALYELNNSIVYGLRVFPTLSLHQGSSTIPCIFSNSFRATLVRLDIHTIFSQWDLFTILNSFPQLQKLIFHKLVYEFDQNYIDAIHAFDDLAEEYNSFLTFIFPTASSNYKLKELSFGGIHCSANVPENYLFSFHSQTFPQIESISINSSKVYEAEYLANRRQWFNGDSIIWSRLRCLDLNPVESMEIDYVIDSCPNLEILSVSLILNNDGSNNYIPVINTCNLILLGFKHLKSFSFSHCSSQIYYDPYHIFTDDQHQFEDLYLTPRFLKGFSNQCDFPRMLTSMQVNHIDWKGLSYLNLSNIAIFSPLILYPISKLRCLESLALSLYNLDGFHTISSYIAPHYNSNDARNRDAEDDLITVQPFENLGEFNICFEEPPHPDSGNVEPFVRLFPLLETIELKCTSPESKEIGYKVYRDCCTVYFYGPLQLVPDFS